MFGGVFSERQELIRATVKECENSPSGQNNVDACNSSKKGYIGPFIHDDVEIYTISLPNEKGEFTNLYFKYGFMKMLHLCIFQIIMAVLMYIIHWFLSTHLYYTKVKSCMFFDVKCDIFAYKIYFVVSYGRPINFKTLECTKLNSEYLVQKP